MTTISSNIYIVVVVEDLIMGTVYRDYSTVLIGVIYFGWSSKDVDIM